MCANDTHTHTYSVNDWTHFAGCEKVILCIQLMKPCGTNLTQSLFSDDTTRVKIKSSGGDYINANFVNVSGCMIGWLQCPI